MKNKVLEFLKDESGQTSTEYILLVAVVAAHKLNLINAQRWELRHAPLGQHQRAAQK